ncbi:MAG: hypothetical protein IPQ07_03370 [Myxococcales bacterium]|nr:hypothetical protein [Myxococcales bacterium]
MPGLQAAPTSPASSAPYHGVYLDDLDRSVAPCTDFFEYGNGSWRKANPIPASMARWSRRWKSGEDAGPAARDPRSVAAKRDWKTGSVEQLIGDFYVACMDEAKADQLGAGPIVPMLGKIAAIKDRAGVVAMIGDLDRQGIPVPLLLREAEKRFADARAKYVVHVAKLLPARRCCRGRGEAEGQGDLRPSRPSSRRPLSTCGAARSAATDHKMSVGDPEAVARVRLDEVPRRWSPPVVPLNVEQPTFVKEVQRQLTRTSIADWKSYLAFHHRCDGAPVVEAVRRRAVRVQRPVPPGRAGAEAALEAVRRAHLTAARGEALGQKYVEKYFPPPAKARMKTLVDYVLLGMKETIEHLDWMTDATREKALEKLATVNTKIGYPDKWKDLGDPDPGRRHVRQRDRREDLELDDDRKDGRQAGGPRALGMTPPTSNAYYNPR